MRLIDADNLTEGLKLHYQDTDLKYEADRRWAVGYNAGLERALYYIAHAKTIDSRQNEPLTIEELRAMDGEPVWVEMLVGSRPAHWAIIHGHLAHDGRFNDDKGRCIVSFGETGGYGMAWLAYRRKPEGGTGC